MVPKIRFFKCNSIKRKTQNKSLFSWNGKKKHIVGTIPKSKIKIVERGKIDTLRTQIHDRSLSWLGTDTSIRSGGVKLV